MHHRVVNYQDFKGLQQELSLKRVQYLQELQIQQLNLQKAQFTQMLQLDPSEQQQKLDELCHPQTLQKDWQKIDGRLFSF